MRMGRGGDRDKATSKSTTKQASTDGAKSQKNVKGSRKSSQKKKDVENLDERNNSRENIGLTILNLSSRILIAVFIGIPYALKEAGFGLGIILILLIAFLTDYTLRLLIRAGELAKEDTYVGVMGKAFGTFGASAVITKQFIYPFITMIASNIIIADILLKVIILIANEHDITGIQDNFYGKREFIISVTTVIVTLPLSMYRHLGALSKWAGFCILFLVSLIVFAIVRLDTLNMPMTDDAYRFASIDVGRAVGILIAAYMCQHSSFMIFRAMINPTEHRKNEVTHISVVIALLITLTFGIIGYATFTQNTEGNILNNYCTKDTLMNVGRIFFVLSVMVAFPVEAVICRKVVERSIFANYEVTPLWIHVPLTIIIVAGTVGFSFLTDCVSIMLELNGVANAAPLAFIFPPILVMKLQKDPVCCTKNIPLMLVAVFGLAVAGFGLYLTIISIIDGVKCSHGEEPAFCLDSAFNMTTMLPMTTV